MSKIQVLFGSTVAIFNLCHRKFNIKFVDDEGQKMLAQLVLQRLNLGNPLDCPEVVFPFSLKTYPRADDKNWQTVLLKDFDEAKKTLPIPIPILKEEHFEAAMTNWTMGNYRLLRAIQYILVARRRELNAITKPPKKRGDAKEPPCGFATYQDYLLALSRRPENLELRIRHLEEKPDTWDEEYFGIWPSGGLLFVRCRLPSANRSESNPTYDKMPLLAFSKTDPGHLGLIHELRFLAGWRCHTPAKGVIDQCSRIMGTGKFGDLIHF